jgi:hypothetical protein
MRILRGDGGRFAEGSAKILSIALIVYWGLFALLAPVTNWDSQVYNLGRLPIASLGGLFGNPFWTTPRQLMFPWTFDAIHLPLLSLGFGYGLPSYLCLLGVLEVAWSYLAGNHGRDAGWMGVLGLLALPTLVFQAVITKNDIPVLFGVAVWFHAMRLWRKDGRTFHLAFSALAIGFACGSKTTGIVPGCLCFGVSCWELCPFRSKLRAFLSATLVSGILFGSVETYAASYQRYGHPMGPEDIVRDNANHDGARGAVANAIRYAFGNIDLGVEEWQAPDRLTPLLETTCRRWLSILSLTNAGCRSDFSDKRLEFLKNNGDSGSGYGLAGFAGLLVLFLAAFWWRTGDDWWRMCAFGGTVATGICCTVAWMEWNDRFLMVPFAIFTLALVSLVYRCLAGNKWAIGTLVLLFAYSAVAGPLLSFNKRPGDLVSCLMDRRRQEFKERPFMFSVFEAERTWCATHPRDRLYLLAGVDSWVLPFLTPPNRFVLPVGIDTTPAELKAILGRGPPAGLLVLDRTDFNPSGLPLTEIQSFPGKPGTNLFEVIRGKPNSLGPSR